MAQPPGYSHPNLPNHVCKLKRSLYGLKQAPRAWFGRLSNYLITYGFMCSKYDPSMFIYKQGNIITLMLIYVDEHYTYWY